MAFRSARCPSCNKDIQVPDDVASPLCMYCGKSVPAQNHRPRELGPSVANLLGLARTAVVGGNLGEAESYFSRVLELDPTVSEAWLGKGKSAGWQSTILNIRLGEVLAAFGHSIGTAPQSSRAAAIQSCLHEVNALVVAIHVMARKHMTEFISAPNSWANYLAQVGQLLDALEAASTWNPGDRTTLENIVRLCKDNIEGVKYRDPFENNAAKAWHLSPQYEALIRGKMERASQALREIDPGYVPPVAEAKKPDACFVVTATMGDEHHPTVGLIRRLRDDWMLTFPSGKKAVALYYRYSPPVARFIGRKLWRRALSYVLVVAPAAWLARRLLKNRVGDGAERDRFVS